MDQAVWVFRDRKTAEESSESPPSPYLDARGEKRAYDDVAPRPRQGMTTPPLLPLPPNHRAAGRKSLEGEVAARKPASRHG